MATSTTELILKFSGDPRNLKETLAQVRGDLTNLSKAQVSVAKESNKQVATEAKAQTKLLEQEEKARVRAAESLQRQKSAAIIAGWKAEAREAEKSTREVARIMAETARQAAAQERIRERAAKQLADAQIREAKRAAKELEESLKNSSSGSSLSALSSVAGQIPALRNVTSQLSSYTDAIESAGTATAGLAGPIGVAIVAITAEVGAVIALTKEIFGLTKASAEYQGQLLDVSQQTGISVETLSALEVMARTTGGSLESLSASLGIFQKHLEEASEDPSSKAAKALKDLGVEATNTEDALRQTIAAIARMPEGFRQTATALELFGRGGKAVLAIAKESHGDIDGVIDRLKRLGLVTTQEAQLADAFNDQLAILEIQMRGLGTKAIPVVLDVLQSLSKTLEDNRDLFNVLQGIVKAVALTISVPLKVAIGFIKTEFEKARPVLVAIAETFERIKAAIEFISGHPVTVSAGGESAATGAGAGTTEAAKKDPFTQQLEDEVSARKRLQGVLNFDFEERRRKAQDNIALAQREFEAGKRTRQQLLDTTIESLRKQTQAEIDALGVERGIKLAEVALAKDDLDKRTQISNAILAIDNQVADKKASLRRTEADLRAKAELDERKSSLAHQQAQFAQLSALGEEKIKKIEAEIKNEITARKEGLDAIEKIENETLIARGQLLKKELALAGVGPERQAVLDKITAIGDERQALERRQAERRAQLQKEANTKDLEAIKRSVSEREVVRDGERNRIARDLDKGLIAQSGAITREMALLTEAHIDRLKIIDAELEKAETVAERRRELLSERTKEEQKFTDDFKLLTQQRIDAMLKEGAAATPPPGTLPARSDRDIAREAGAAADKAAGVAPPPGLTGDVFEKLGGVIQQTLGLAGETAKNFGDLIADTFGNVAQAVGSAVQAFVLFGTVQGGFRKFAAEVIASVAQMAVVQAVFEAAQGLAMLALTWFTGNPKYAQSAGAHFAAAAAFGIIGGVAALAGRAVAGNSFSQAGASGGGNSGGGGTTTKGTTATTQPVPVNLDRATLNQQAIVVHLDIKTVPGVTVDAVLDDHNNNGPIRQMILSEIKRSG